MPDEQECEISLSCGYTARGTYYGNECARRDRMDNHLQTASGAGSSESEQDIITGPNNLSRAVPVFQAKERAHGPFLREPINSSGHQTSPLLQTHTPSLVLLPGLPQPHPRFVCPFVARAVYLAVYLTVHRTEEGLMALPSLLY